MKAIKFWTKHKAWLGPTLVGGLLILLILVSSSDEGFSMFTYDLF